VGSVDVLLIGLLGSVAGLAAIARAFRIPDPVVLVAGGLAVGLVPGAPTIRLEPDLVLVLFLPPLLYSSAFFADLRGLRADRGAISALAIGLVLATTAATAVAAHAACDIPWAAAFALGAIVAPTDPAAAIVIIGRLGLPRRVVDVLEGESLLNDASALVAYRIAVAAAAGGGFSVIHAGGEFAADVAGGIAVGLAIGRVVVEVRRRIEDPILALTVSLLSGYAGYLPAEHLGVSGVMAAVMVGAYVGRHAPRIASPAQRLAAVAVWELLSFLLNALLFILVGLQLPVILRGLHGDASAGALIVDAVLISAVVIGARLVGVYAVAAAERALGRHLGDARERAVIAWTGMRGAVSLAAALALPDTLPDRGLIVFLTFSVIVSTLLLQGLTLPALIQRLGLEAPGAEAEEERLARDHATRAALSRIDELDGTPGWSGATLEQVRASYRDRRQELAAPDGEARRARQEAIAAERRRIIELRDEGAISSAVMHRLERELDLAHEHTGSASGRRDAGPDYARRRRSAGPHGADDAPRGGRHHRKRPVLPRARPRP
jgi:CPA1 family monovalent cation:H+ antiporter